MTSLRVALKQSRPFTSVEQEAWLSLAKTSALLEHRIGELLRSHGVTVTQYNVLRILRGAGTGGLCRNEIRDRMITEVPDVTRLLDRLEELGYVARERSTVDRRLVHTTITRTGLALLAALDEPIDRHHRAALGVLPAAKLRTLIALLEELRGGL